MSETETKYGIVVGVDGSAESRAAVRWAAREASMRHEAVTLVHVVQAVIVSWPIGAQQAAIAKWQESNARDVIVQARNDLTDAMDKPQPLEVRTEILYANPVHALVDASQEARMVVVGSRGRGVLGRLLLGSVSSGVLHHAYCPVAVIHADEVSASAPEGPVLLGIDGSPASEGATAYAFEEASLRGLSLVALHAWSDVAVFPILGMDWRTYQDQGQEALSERLAGWQERYPDVRIERRLVCDTPARWLIEESQRAQLVVLGSRGRGGFDGMLLGSASATVAQSARVPVVVVRTR
ncbi:universal stress protein [Mycobacterium kyorinense]|uniref:Universal stress protein n=1 Tax=Mycobacterium kyorinense TaxID=487514 RepID=A0A1A2YPW4_9MYCO|nr:universal stress protein [Mycobacterium kyorinense]OBI40274.1 universal stress protein [Mycobacterium kyorinense]